jgi:hypothetical protein
MAPTHFPCWQIAIAPFTVGAALLMKSQDLVIARARQSVFHDGHPGVEQSTDLQSAGLPIHLII